MSVPVGHPAHRHGRSHVGWVPVAVGCYRLERHRVNPHSGAKREHGCPASRVWWPVPAPLDTSPGWNYRGEEINHLLDFVTRAPCAFIRNSGINLFFRLLIAFIYRFGKPTGKKYLALLKELVEGAA